MTGKYELRLVEFPENCIALAEVYFEDGIVKFINQPEIIKWEKDSVHEVNVYRSIIEAFNKTTIKYDEERHGVPF